MLFVKIKAGNSISHKKPILVLFYLTMYDIFSDLPVIEGIFNQVKQIYDRIKLAQTNIRDLMNTISAWSNQPLYERKEGKKENLLGLDDRAERIQKRRELVTSCSNDLQKILKENCILFLQMPLEEISPDPDVAAEPEISPKPAEKSPEEKKGKGNLPLFDSSAIA